MSGHGRRHRGILGRTTYDDLPQEDDEQELNSLDRDHRPQQPEEEEKAARQPLAGGRSGGRGGGGDGRGGGGGHDPGLPHHHRRHPLRGEVHSDSDDPTAYPPDEGYSDAHRDFRRHYKGARPPTWDRRATFRPDGTGELQTYFPSLGENVQSQLAREFNHRRQFLRLIGKILLRWVASLILSIAMVIAFYQYEKVKILDTKAKRWFNAVSTGLYLTLGLNLAASLKGMAIIIRWKLLSRKRHQLEEVDFLLGLSSLIKVFRYGIHIIKPRPLTSLACFAWILFNAIGRLSVALTGLTYSYDSFGAVSSQPGLANVTNWSTFAQHDAVSLAPNTTPESERYSAHAYGLFSAILENRNLTTPGESDPNEPEARPIEVATNGSYYYYFREWNPKPKNPHNNLAHKSDRSVEVRAACTYYPLVSGQDGNSDTVVYLNGTTNHTLDGVADHGPSATTWINPRSDLARNAQWACGPRCASVAALQFLDSDTEGPGAFYDCEVRISRVSGATAPQHEIPDATAATVAGSIGLEGYSTGPDQWEYVRYTPDSPWSNYYSPNLTDASTMARLAARFAVGAIAMKDLYGLRTAQAPGHVAWVGVLLKIKWPALLLILGGILVAQLLLGVAVVAYSNTVFCKDDSYLSTARLLRPVVERLGPSGCAMAGHDIAHTLREQMVYGIRTDDTGQRHHLDLGEDIQPLRWFPEGWYDGHQEWVDVADGAEAVDAVRGAPPVQRGGAKKMAVAVRKRRAFRRA